MCGIAGVFVLDPAAADAGAERRLRAALARLTHRGPDDEGLCTTRGLLLGHRRLAILDLTAAGHQPMQSPDGRWICSLNGEIYNYLELRTELGDRGHRFRTGTDTEVLLAAFAEWGERSLERLRGQFAFAMWDTTERRLWLARDRVGEKPLHYWRDRERIVFASEIKAMLELLPRAPALMPDSIATYLHYQYVIEPRTLLEGIEKVPAGHVLGVDAASWSAQPRPYWALADVPPLDGDPVSRLRGALDTAVDFTLRSDAPVGVALSGGLDSGVLAALARRTRRDLTAFTVGYPGRREFDERADARALAAHLDIPWYSAEIETSDLVSCFPRLVEMLDEPIADVAAYAHYRVSRLASEHGVKVLLTGIGGDELLYGYGWVRDALRLSRRKLDSPPAGLALAHAKLVEAVLRMPGLLRVLVNHRLPRWWRATVDRALDAGRLDVDHPGEWVFYQLDYHWGPAGAFSSAVFTDEFAGQLSPRAPYKLMAGMQVSPIPLEVSIASLLFASWLVSNCLDLGDRVSMASSVETRVPLLDAGVIETAVGLWRAGHAEDAQGHKTWLRQIAREVLPPEVCDRPKRGFVPPTREWMRAVTGAYRDRLSDGVLVQDGVLDGARLRSWLAGTTTDTRREFFEYKLTLLELWCRTVLRGERAASVEEAHV